jgi:hypothetical protein
VSKHKFDSMNKTTAKELAATMMLSLCKWPKEAAKASVLHLVFNPCKGMPVESPASALVVLLSCMLGRPSLFHHGALAGHSLLRSRLPVSGC